MFLEVTGERINFKKILTANTEELLRDIERILFDSKGNRGKMTQLADECGRRSDSKTEFALMVSEESFPENVFWYEIINRRFQEQHDKEPPRRFMVLTIEDVEHVLNIVLRGQSLGDVLQELWRGMQRGVPFSNTLIEMKAKTHPFTNVYYDEFCQGAVLAMFGKGLPDK